MFGYGPPSQDDLYERSEESCALKSLWRAYPFPQAKHYRCAVACNQRLPSLLSLCMFLLDWAVTCTWMWLRYLLRGVPWDHFKSTFDTKSVSKVKPPPTKKAFLFSLRSFKSHLVSIVTWLSLGVCALSVCSGECIHVWQGYSTPLLITHGDYRGRPMLLSKQ